MMYEQEAVIVPEDVRVASARRFDYVECRLRCESDLRQPRFEVEVSVERDEVRKLFDTVEDLLGFLPVFFHNLGDLLRFLDEHLDDIIALTEESLDGIRKADVFDGYVEIMVISIV